jgi:DNA-binding NarL/FixJ family response regulator
VRLQEKIGDYAKALKYYKDYHNLYEAFYDAEQLKIAKNLEEKYESEKKEQAIQYLHQQNALNRKMKYLYAFIALLAVIAGLFVFRSLQQEKEDAALQARIKEQEVKQLEFEKHEAGLLARLKEEETLRLLIEQKLLQEREERLQKDLLAMNLQVEQKDELLQTVQKKIEESTENSFVVKKINNIIDQNKKSDETFATNKAEFDTIRPEFFQQLKDKSGDKLSRLDLKHCAYISLGLTNKEIAQRLGIAPKSILMARYRIKIKLGLSKDDDLDGYIGKLS